MKKILLAGTAIVGTAILASPVQADLKIDLGDHFRGYGVFADNDETGGAGTSNDLRDFEDFLQVTIRYRRQLLILLTRRSRNQTGQRRQSWSLLPSATKCP